MNSIEYMVALLFGSAGCALALGLIWVTVSAAVRAFGRSQDGLRLKRISGKLEAADRLIEAEKWTEALKELERAILLDTGIDRDSIRKIRDHHQNVLSRCLVIAEELSVHPSNIADVERLFSERAELQTLYSKSVEAYQRVRSKRAQAGKQTPTWTRSDYDSRSKEISDQLRDNRKKLGEELSRFFSMIQSRRTDEIVYH